MLVSYAVFKKSGKNWVCSYSGSVELKELEEEKVEKKIDSISKLEMAKREKPRHKKKINYDINKVLTTVGINYQANTIFYLRKRCSVEQLKKFQVPQKLVSTTFYNNPFVDHEYYESDLQYKRCGLNTKVSNEDGIIIIMR